MELKAVIRTTPLVEALKDGRVEPRGYTLRFEEVQPITKAFRIMCRDLAFDVCEMAATTYLVARDYGKPFTALPVFLTRGLHHTAVKARRPGNPKELEGQRVGDVPRQARPELLVLGHRTIGPRLDRRRRF